MYRCRPLSHRTILAGAARDVGLKYPQDVRPSWTRNIAFRCNDVVKTLPGPPHPFLNMLKEAVNFMKIVTCLAMFIPWSDHVA